MNSQVAIISCTRRQEESRDEVLLCQSFDHGGFGRFAELEMVWGNSEGLPKVYNRKLNQFAKLGIEFLVFCHDDVYLDDLKLSDKLVAANRGLGYDIIGVAGAAGLKMVNPSLWHLMSEPSHRRGYVHHFSKGGQLVCTSFGPTPSRVVVLDGLFIALHVPSVMERGWKFNENYDFHHYDLASCLDAMSKGLSVGVYPIHTIHESHGLDSFSNPAWLASNERFLAEYSRPLSGF